MRPTDASVPGLVLLAGIFTAAVNAGWRARRWRRGRPANVALWRGLLKIPRRYLRDVHEVVARDAAASRMHMLVAGGFVTSLPLVLVVTFFDLGRTVPWLLVAVLFLMVVGVGIVAWRRIPTPSRLSRGRFDWLCLGLVAYVAFFAIATVSRIDAPASVDWTRPWGMLLLAVGAFGVFETAGHLSGGAMRHALAGALHLAWHPRPARFGAGIDAALVPLDLGAPKLGIERPEDFAWNQLLGFDACVECGRCEAACPAFAAGLPLNPKKLIQDLVAAAGEPGSDHGYSGSPHPGLPIGQAKGGPDQPLVGPDRMIHSDTLWACTTCRACVHECPMMIEHVDAVISLRRFETLERGATPQRAAALLAELAATDNHGGLPSARRSDWATGLQVPLLAETGRCRVLLWQGEGAFALRHQRSLRALVSLLRLAAVDFAILGPEELDCGDLARRLGDEAAFQDLARRSIALLGRYEFQMILTADPHVLHCLKNEYPALGGHYRVVHHTTFLAELLRRGALPNAGNAPSMRVTYHDPCYLGRYNGETGAPRALLGELGLDLAEMERSGLRSRCCGGGGGAPVTDVLGRRRMPDVRMDEARATDARQLVVACPTCAVMFEGVVSPRPQVIDIAELMLERLGDAG